MKHIKKIGALVLALVMVLAMSTTAFAAGTKTDEGTLTISSGEVTFKKEIVVLNSGSSNVWEPNISYKYTITPVTGLSNVTVTDGTTPDPVTAVVKDGKAGGLLINNVTGTTGRGTSATITFGDDTSSAQASSPLNTTDFSTAKTAARTLYLSFDTTKFVDDSGVLLPGVYRYKMTEELGDSSNTYAAAGVTQGSYSADRYLDVYVKWTDNTMSALKVYGLTMFTSNNSIENGTPADDTFKVTGYDVATEGNNADVYKTYNLTVEKAVAGTMADKNHSFPFTIALAENTATAVQFYATGDSYTGADLTFTSNAWSVNAGYSDNNLKLKDGQKINLIGLPLTTTATVAEKDDTVDYYTATAVDVNNTTSLALTNNTTDKTWTTAANAVAIGTTSGSETNTVTFTNTLTEISPTGYVVRIAPYVLMLAGGIALLVVTRRRREDSQAA
ncbi:MAG: hypothetical protein IJL59_02180 [Clostridia bacterium]|nr:hypothetical protein [Clostridia bacterium]